MMIYGIGYFSYLILSQLCFIFLLLKLMTAKQKKYRHFNISAA